MPTTWINQSKNINNNYLLYIKGNYSNIDNLKYGFYIRKQQTKLLMNNRIKSKKFMFSNSHVAHSILKITATESSNLT